MPMGDVVPRPERIDDRVARRSIHWAKAEAAVERRQREPCSRLLVAAVGHRADEEAADQADAFQGIKVDRRMGPAVGERLDAVGKRIDSPVAAVTGGGTVSVK